ncbi:hypothetical protein BGX34_000179 [Mortierella sp. NVP85]|nr:hypothetical protein BGX34_000179 [Mortierella sp. NVP85]
MNNKSTATDEGIRSSNSTASYHQYRHKFGYENSHVSGALSLWAGSNLPEYPAIISEKVSSFEAEEDTTGSLDVILPHEKLEKLEMNGTFDLELEEVVIVQPYQRGNQSEDRQWATVVVVMSNCTSHDDVKYSGLQVDHVELLSLNGSNDGVEENVTKVVVERAVKPKSSIDIMKSPVFHQSTVETDIPISRLAWSKGGTFLAALALSDNAAYITVWNMEHWDSSKPEDMHKKCATAVVDGGRNLKDLSIGLAISPNGSQLAVYQEPIVGEWTDGSGLSNSTFKFHLLTLASKQDTRQDKSKQGDHVNVSIDPTTGADAGNNPSQGHAPPATPQLSGIECRANRIYEKSNLLHPTLSTFVGYGAFLADHDIAKPVGATKDGKGGNNPNGNIDSPDCTTQSTTSKRLFVACNGIFIDIFKIRPGLKWRHSHSIRLTDLTPTISRRITCKMMMDQISRNRFMWLEDGGVCCSIWDLQKGSNISYVSSSDNTRLGCPTFRGNSTISISPDESMVALANVEGVLTTFYANTGIAISSKKFKDEQIEYVSFNGQNNQLFVITRHIITLKPESRILDPLRLNSGVSVNQVPVPVINRTILAFFRAERFKNNGLVCEADGSKIHCYFTREPAVLAKSDFKIVQPTDVPHSANDNNKPETKVDQILEIRDNHSPVIKDQKSGTNNAQNPEMNDSRQDVSQREAVGALKDKQYKVRTVAGIKLTRDDDDSMCWILRVEVIERHRDHYGEHVVFSFVPEPWMRISAADVLHPEHLLKVYFLPGQKRFVVAGIQTLQIWNLPANDSDDFNLAFIWSRPKVKDDLVKLDGKASKNRTIDQRANTNPKNPGGAADGKAVENPATRSRMSSLMPTINGDDIKAIIDLGKLRDKAAMKQKNDGKRTVPKKTIETEPVGEYYHFIRNLGIYLDQSTGEAQAHVELKEGFGLDVVDIPGERNDDSHSVFLNCARSIHLLAACYAYSTQESEKFPKNLEKSSFIFKEHAEAIARFTRGHINRLLPWVYFVPPQIRGNMTPGVSPGVSPKASSVAAPEEPQLALSAGLPVVPRIKSHARTLSIPHIFRYLKRSNHEAPHPQLLRALEYASKFTQELVAMPSEQPFLSPVTLEDQLERWDEQREKSRAPRHEGTSLDGIFTVLTLLLDQKDLKGTNRVFIEGLFATADHEWIPHPSMALNPIKRVIDIKDERLLKVLIDYCIKNAKEHHPGYLTPVIQCLSKLSSEGYSDVMCDLFRRTSHIPARNPEYVASHAIIVNLRFLDVVNSIFQYLTFATRGWFIKPSTIHNHEAPVFSVRSQLPLYSRSRVSTFVRTDILFGRQLMLSFPKRESAERTQPTAENRMRNIYVSPFQFKPIKGPNGRERSFLSEIAGKDFFDSPAIEASLWYKWSKSGAYFWSAHFIVLLVFFTSVMTITGQQIQVSKLPITRDPTADEIAARYLPGWRPAFYLTIAVGLILTIYEILQMKFSTWKYFVSPFNYVHLAAYLFPVAGCFIFLNAEHGIRDGLDVGPEQIYTLAFAILLLYLNIIFELRIIAPLGRAVNIIVNIAKNILWFLLIFAVFIVCFTHALLYVLHTQQYRKCEEWNTDGTCKDTNYRSKYPTDFLEAFSTTYFFLSGRYEPVEDSFLNGSTAFRAVMVIFFFFTAILLLNLLIALMNHIFNKSEKEGERAYWKLLSEVLSEMEMVTMYSERAGYSDSHSEYVYYCASDEEVKKFQSRSEMLSLTADPSKAGHSETISTQRMILKSISDVKSDVAHGNEALNKRLDTLDGRGQNPYSHTEPREKLVELKDLDGLKQDLAALKSLVEDMALQLRAISTTKSG